MSLHVVSLFSGIGGMCGICGERARNHRRGRHLTYVTYGGPTWQAKAAHAGVLRKDKTP